MTTNKYRITVWNRQGAAESVHRDTIQGCKDWLNDTWHDAEDLKAVIEETLSDYGTYKVIAEKRMGRLSWIRLDK